MLDGIIRDVRAYQPLQDVVGIDRTGIHLRLAFFSQSHIIGIQWGMAIKRAFVARRRQRRHLGKFDAIPPLGTHLGFDHGGQFDQQFAIALGTQTQEIA